MGFQVKTILIRGPNEDDLPKREIRRFEIDDEAVGSYDYLRGKIVTLYPDLTDESVFRLMWTDEDGDNIHFSSDEELAQAMKFSSSTNGDSGPKILKLLIKLANGHKSEGCEDNGNGPKCGQFNFQNFSHPGMTQKIERTKAKAARHSQKYAEQMNFLSNLQSQAGQFASHMAQQVADGLVHGGKAMNDFSSHMDQHMNQHMKNQKNKQNCKTSTSKTSTVDTGNANITKTVVHDNGDVDMHIDIPIKHIGKPENEKETGNEQNTGNEKKSESGSEDWNTVDDEEVKLAKAIKSMEELGFTGKWVEELLKHVNCNIEAAVDALNSK